MKFTLGKIAEDVLCIFWAINFWLARAIDAAESLTSGSTSPFAAPVLTGPSGRSKKLGRSYKNKKWLSWLREGKFSMGWLLAGLTRQAMTG